jgi:hypothetical protein
MPATSKGDRTSPRRRAVLRFQGKAEEVEVEELTSDGCLIRSVNKFEPFAAVSVGLAGIGHIPSRLVWFSGDIYGCSCDKQLPTTATVDAESDNVAYLPRVLEPKPAKGRHRQTPRR